MKLYYYKSALGNFGDDLNGWLWETLLPDFFDEDDSVRFFGIGTIINTEMPSAKKWIVFGSGIGYGYPPAGFGNADWNIICVRGPLSARVLGLNDSQFITDGAAFLNTLAEFKPLAEHERAGTIFIPHHNALKQGDWEKSCQQAGITMVSPREEARAVIQKIRHAKLVLADAMHAAIIADAMRVPWVPMVTSSQINTFKWLDWTQTIRCPYIPTVLGADFLSDILKANAVQLPGAPAIRPGADVEKAVAVFKKQQKLSSTGAGNRHLKKLMSLRYKVPNKLIRLREDRHARAWNEQSVAKVAQRMQQAQQSGGFLSEESVFQHNLSRLLEGLDRVKALPRP